ncbi:MAG: Do family serine endopeptidase [Burkholderiales bacterium]|jgi:serine protease DegQ|nr:Do family serine endopeptidase [Burkholderiales bacterium]MCA3154785.1 Do family serine endopeptidase [Burkholderiales bacterium]MCA3156589.1 Do family serine endopeptidase [Burkholderiales bacterium]MCA3158870.1 Do family serine endopeptidase [Burkholderiales bacterium]MCA3162054.1 Do family serine endopeptidase [Burkholderiales bacterium]
MFKRLWLVFAQAVTVGLAILFIIVTLRPEWLPNRAVSLPVTTQVAPSVHSAGAATSSYAEAVKRAVPAVVNIFTTKEMRVPNSPFGDDPIFRHFFGDRFGSRREQASSLGSGVIVSPQGFILTNNHVIESADEIEVALADGRRAPAKLVGADPETDLAVLRIDLPDLNTRPLPALAFGSIDQVKVGDVVLAIGNPFGFGSTVTMGIISATGRSHLGINTFENFLQTDAAINPGNSGGALVDVSGNLLGVNTAIYSRSGTSAGIGFAIPASIAKQVLDSIVATGQVVRGYIGVETQDVTPELAEAFALPRRDGAIIAGVVRGGPADKAGIKTGDILIAVNGKPITDSTTMLNLIAPLTPGGQAQLTVVRDKREQQLTVTVGQRPKPRPQQ